jgi:hypothetical protein
MYKVIKNIDEEVTVEGEFLTRDLAEERLIDVIADTISNFDDYDFEDIDAIMERGFENTSFGSMYIEEYGEIPEGANV